MRHTYLMRMYSSARRCLELSIMLGWLVAVALTWRSRAHRAEQDGWPRAGAG